MKVMSLDFYRHNYNDSWNPDYDPTNGGVSGRYNEILVACDRGWERDIDPRNPPENLFRIDSFYIGQSLAIHLVPYNMKRKGLIGPMFGGNYADTCDSRWGEMLRDLFGNEYRFNTCLAIHDRYETQELYDALSR